MRVVSESEELFISEIWEGPQLKMFSIRYHFKPVCVTTDISCMYLAIQVKDKNQEIRDVVIRWSKLTIPTGQ